MRQRTLAIVAVMGAVTVMLDAGGADTSGQRAIPGSKFSQGSCAVRPEYVC